MDNAGAFNRVGESQGQLGGLKWAVPEHLELDLLALLEPKDNARSRDPTSVLLADDNGEHISQGPVAPRESKPPALGDTAVVDVHRGLNPPCLPKGKNERHSHNEHAPCKMSKGQQGEERGDTHSQPERGRLAGAAKPMEQTGLAFRLAPTGWIVAAMGSCRHPWLYGGLVPPLHEFSRASAFDKKAD